MRVVVYAVFFLSGVSALAFETLWLHQAGLALGNGVWASALVLAGFMAGLALGNALAGALGERVPRVLPVYAALEVAIAVTGVGIVYWLPGLGVAVASSLETLSERAGLLNLARLIVAFCVMLVPATAMGATLPLLARELSRSRAGFGSVLGRLYGWNTLGAVVGTVGTDAFALGALGIRGTALAAGAINGAAALGAWIAYTRMPEPPPLAPREPRLSLPRPARAWLAAAFVSGFALLALEVVWFRFLSLYVLGHAQSFALMLAVVLAGIAAGGLAASWLLQLRPGAWRLAPGASFLAGLACVVTYSASTWFAPPSPGRLLDGPLEIAQLAIPVMLPVSFLSGAFFVLVGAALREELRSASGTAAALALFNTAGASLGPLVAGFVLLPAVGVEGSLFGAALAYGGLGLALLLRTGRDPYTVAAALLCALALALFPFGDLERRHVPSVVGRFIPEDFARVAEVREGPSETIIYVDRQLLGEHLSYTLLTDGFSMSGTSPLARRYMKLYVYLPVAVRPDPRSALLISFGVGSTAKALTDTSSLERIDVVDISRDILELSDIVYPDPAEHPLRDPRVHEHVEDGRFYLQTTSRRFDLITGEPPPPANAGVVNLYTREYFELMHDRLNEGGVATYWLPLHALSDAAARSVARAFCDAFADCSLWNGSGASLMLVGTRNARGPVSVDRFTEQWRDPVVGPELRELGFERPEQLGALFVGGASYLDALTRGVPALVDDRPKLVEAAEPVQDKVRLVFDDWAGDVQAAETRFRNSPLIARLWPRELREATLPYFEHQAVINLYTQRGIREPSVPIAHRMIEAGLRVPALWALSSSVDIQRMLERLPPERIGHPLFQAHLAIGRLADRDYAGALEPLERAEAQPDLRRDAFRMRIYALARNGEVRRARSLAQERYAALGGKLELAPYWLWMIDEFDVDPRRMTARAR